MLIAFIIAVIVLVVGLIFISNDHGVIGLICVIDSGLTIGIIEVIIKWKVIMLVLGGAG